jgi:TolA-binding protein
LGGLPYNIGIAQDSRFPWVWIYAFTAFVLAIAAGVFAWLAIESRHEAGAGRTANAHPVAIRNIPAERIELLSHFEPPEYTAGGERSATFRSAMEEYQKHDYAGALQTLVQTSPQSVEARFYLAICLALTNDLPDAAKEFHNVIAAGDTPYLEAGHFYLAKDLLGTGNVVGAEQQLRKVIELHGKFEKEAEVLRAQIVPAP